MKRMICFGIFVALLGDWGACHLFAAHKKAQPVSAALQTATASLQSQGMSGQSETLMPDGRTLLLGGNEDGAAVDLGWFKSGQSPTLYPVRGHLKVARSWHTATLLPDDTVFVSGGLGSDGSAVPLAEIFDPKVSGVTRTFQSGLTPRAAHSATLLIDGRVLIVGGMHSDGGPVDSIEVWDYKTQKASVLPILLGTPRSGHKAALQADGSILISGGIDKNGSPIDYNEVIDPVSLTIRTETAGSITEKGQAATLAQALPADGATNVPLNALIGFRFSSPLSVTSASVANITLSASGSTVPTQVVPAENGQLVFVNPQAPLQPGTTYTVSFSGLVDSSGLPVTPTEVSFTTAGPAIGDVTGSGTSASNSGTDLSKSTSPLQAAFGVTALSGRVLVTNGTPLVHVLVEIDSHQTLTDIAGRFLLEGLTPGHHVMIVDGAAANSKSAVWGLYRVGVDIQGSRTTILKYTIWMTPLDTKHVVQISSPTTSNLVITNPSLPGLEVRIPANTVITDAHGHVVRQLGITPIPTTKPPFPLPPGSRPPVYFTIQPGGLSFKTAGSLPGMASSSQAKGIQIVYQNATSARQGTRFNFLNYDPFSKGWHVYGKGRVSSDNRKIVPDAGTQIWTFDGALLSSPTGPPAVGPNSCSTSDGDSVDLQTGLFVPSQTDLSLPGSTPLDISRVYRQGDSGSRGFGIGSGLPDDSYLSGDDDNFPEGWTYQDWNQADGSRVHFTRVTPCGPNGCTCDPSTTLVYVATSDRCDYGATLRHVCYQPPQLPTQKLQNGANPQKLTQHTGNNRPDPSGLLSSPWILTLADGTTYGFPTSYDGENGTDPRTAAASGMMDRNSNYINFNRNGDGSLAQVSGSNGRSIHFTYDNSGRVTLGADSAGRSVSYGYDVQGRLSSFTDAAGTITSYTYDDNDNLVSIIKPDKNIRVTNSYDENGRVAQQTFSNGGTYQFTYATDGSGNVTQTTVTDPSGSVRQVQFNGDGHIISDIVGFGTAQQEATTYELQPTSGLMLSGTDALGRKTSFTYDALGETTSVTHLVGTGNAVTTYYGYPPLLTPNGGLSSPTFGMPNSVTDSLGNTTMLVYDGSGNLVNITDPLGNVTSLTYNEAGQILTQTDALENTTHFSYDSGDLVGITDPLGRTTSRFLDAAGRLISTIDPAGHTTQYTYTPLDQISTIIDPLGSQTSFSYYPNRTLHTVTDANQHTTTYTYDNMDRLQTRQDSLGSSESYQYDANSRVQWYTDRRGVITGYSYDSVGRRVFAGFGYNGSSYNSTINYTFDVGDRLTDTLDSLAGAIHRTFDGLGGLLSETTPQDSVSYTYDANERRKTMTVAGQPTVQYTLDAAGRLTQIAQNSNNVSFTYDAAGRRTSLTLPNGVLAKYGYDQASELISVKYHSGSAALGDLEYTYDPAGRRTGVTGSFARTNLPNAVSGATYNQNNQLTQWGSTSPTYDPNGNLQNDGINSYSWNSRNQLASMNAGTDVFSYDSFGRRIAKSISGNAKAFSYDGVNIVQQLQGGNATSNLLTGSVDEVFLRIDSSGTWNFLTDALGSTTALADSTGEIQTQYTYEPFGNTTVTGAATGNTNQYSGRELDETGLYFYRARYYSSQTSRFLSEDPLGFRGSGPNLYEYGGNDPISNKDPEGKSTYDCTAPLEALGWFGYPVYYTPLGWVLEHEYLCVRTKDQTICNGLDRTGDAGWFNDGSPGQPSNDTWEERSGTCQKKSDDDCVDRCVLKELNNPERGDYNVINKGGINCQKWSKVVLKKCKNECEAEK